MNKYKQIKKELKNKKELVAYAQQLGVVGEMANILDTSTSVVSHSVKKLLELEFVTRRKEAQTVYYSLSVNNFTTTLKSFIT